MDTECFSTPLGGKWNQKIRLLAIFGRERRFRPVLRKPFFLIEHATTVCRSCCFCGAFSLINTRPKAANNWRASKIWRCALFLNVESIRLFVGHPKQMSWHEHRSRNFCGKGTHISLVRGGGEEGGREKGGDGEEEGEGWSNSSPLFNLYMCGNSLSISASLEH